MKQKKTDTESKERARAEAREWVAKMDRLHAEQSKAMSADPWIQRLMRRASGSSVSAAS